MHTRSFLIVMVVFTGSILISIDSLAQVPTAAVNVTCEEKMEISVESSTSLSENITCTVENPTVYVEKVDISVDSGEFAHSGPGSIYVGPGSSEDFDVVIQADQGTSTQSQTISVTGTVTELSGFPPINAATDEATFVLNILQYGACSIGSQNSFTEAKTGEELTLTFQVYNQGNGEDIMDIGLTDASLDLLEDLGFIPNFPLESITIEEQNQPVRIILNLMAPDQLSADYAANENRIANIEVEVEVTSRVSCESEQGCKSDSTISVLDLIEQEDSSSEDDLLGSGEGSDSFMMFGAGVLSSIVFLSLVYTFMKKT